MSTNNKEGLLLCPFCGSDARTINNTDDIPTWAQCTNHGHKKKGAERCPMSHALVPIPAWNRRSALTASEAPATEQAPPFKECRHCGWECRPITAASKKWYPLEQAPAGEVPIPPMSDEATQEMVDAAFSEMEKRGFRVSASDLGMGDIKAIYHAMRLLALSAPPAVPSLPPLPAPLGTMELNWGTPYAKDIDAYDETQMRGYAISAVLRALSAPPAVPPKEWRKFIEDVATQQPEKPDHWSSCGQCERNTDRAQDLLSAAPAAPQGEQPTNESAVSAAMAEGNKHGVKSTVAASIVAAYLNALTGEQK